MYSGLWAGNVKIHYGCVVKKNRNSPKSKEKIQQLNLGPVRFCQICHTSVGSSEKCLISDDKILVQSQCLFQNLANIGIVDGIEKPITTDKIKQFLETKFIDAALLPFQNMEKPLGGLFNLQEKIFGPVDFAAICNRLRLLPEFAEL